MAWLAELEAFRSQFENWWIWWIRWLFAASLLSSFFFVCRHIAVRAGMGVSLGMPRGSYHLFAAGECNSLGWKRSAIPKPDSTVEPDCLGRHAANENVFCKRQRIRWSRTVQAPMASGSVRVWTSRTCACLAFRTSALGVERCLVLDAVAHHSLRGPSDA